MGTAVFCLAGSEFQAESIVNELRVAGFSDREISVLLPDKSGAVRGPRPNARQSEAGAAENRSQTVGGALGWLTGIEALNVPGAGPFIASGPILAAFKGAAISATHGTISKCLQGMGLPDSFSRVFEQKIRQGQIFISLYSDHGDAGARATAIFEQAGAEQITTAIEIEPSREAR